MTTTSEQIPLAPKIPDPTTDMRYRLVHTIHTLGRMDELEKLGLLLNRLINASSLSHRETRALARNIFDEFEKTLVAASRGGESADRRIDTLEREIEDKAERIDALNEELTGLRDQNEKLRRAPDRIEAAIQQVKDAARDVTNTLESKLEQLAEVAVFEHVPEAGDE